VPGFRPVVTIRDSEPTDTQPKPGGLGGNTILSNLQQTFTTPLFVCWRLAQKKSGIAYLILYLRDSIGAARKGWHYPFPFFFSHPFFLFFKDPEFTFPLSVSRSIVVLLLYPFPSKDKCQAYRANEQTNKG
jgi:hypothetical protein